MGVWTKALKEVGFERVIALEPQSLYHQWMERINATSDKKFEVLKKDGYDWDSYTELKDPKYGLDELADTDWSKGKLLST